MTQCVVTTIEEISGENREYFEEHGGERFQYIPCLNDRPDHIQFLGELIERHAQGWPEMNPSRDKHLAATELEASACRAQALKSTEPANA